VCDRQLLSRGLQTLAIPLEESRLDNILTYCRELQKWNTKINLIARNTPADEVIDKHFLDSLTLLPIIVQYGGKTPTLLDVGTGAGFPGLVLAAVVPELQVTLVEPREKRVVFLRHIVRTLGLENVRIIVSRLEQAGLESERFTFITSRAVAGINRFLPMVENLATWDTRVIVMRSAQGEEQDDIELADSGWQLVEDLCFTLPQSGAARLLSVLRRV